MGSDNGLENLGLRARLLGSAQAEGPCSPGTLCSHYSPCEIQGDTGLPSAWSLSLAGTASRALPASLGALLFPSPSQVTQAL